ncbi:TPA: hypothetical protein N0F65_011523 [Lagenidium giganteum]|uniref:1,3-beta-glucanosyltransferase n=1 Tax=Lagenidium giganteum TaxID=4803 RepID=A0AAV2Z4E7_9STRA|nr:TPA: hypothetical protein N0F65_011523 [Lagenidium giganteum]
MIRASSWFRRLVALVCLGLGLAPTHAWLPHVVRKGNKLFYSDSGREFRMKGMAYYPRPNAGELAPVNNYDWASDDHEAVWAPHLKVMQSIGVNTVRLYAVDPSKPHDKFMCAASQAGIYVLVGMAASCENCAILDAKPPKCYPDALFTRAQMIYNAFAVYDNTLGFSVGNENNLQNENGPGGSVTAPCVKAFLRDVRNYASSCGSSMRQVPIGLDVADIPPRSQWLAYYDCVVDKNEFTRAEWLGFNPYVECNPVDHTSYSQSAGLRAIMKDYADAAYSRPIMFGEFGCNAGANTVNGFENQRAFRDAQWMNEEPEMTNEIVGGCVFEFSTEIANLKESKTLTKTKDAGKFGVGYFQPDACDNNVTTCEFKPYPEFDNLKKAYLNTKKSNLTFAKYTPTRNQTLSCPAGMSTDLPPMPNVKVLACSVAQPVCGGKKSNSFKKQAGKPMKMGQKSSPSNDPVETAHSNSGSNNGDGDDANDAGSNGNGKSAVRRSAGVAVVGSSASVLASALVWIVLTVM